MLRFKRLGRKDTTYSRVIAAMRMAFLFGFVLLTTGCGWLAMDDERAVLDMQKVQVGQDVTIVVPSDQLFYARTANFKPQAFDMLESLVAYLKDHKVNRFDVKGYVDNLGNDALNKLVSKNQSEEMMRYLWKNLDQVVWARFEGLGAKDPIANDRASISQGRNRRLVVLFHDSH